MDGPSQFPSAHPPLSHHHLALPGFHDFSAFADPHHDPGVGPSRRSNSNRPPAPRVDTQHFMSEVNAAHASSNGAPRQRYYDDHPPYPPMTGDPNFDILDWYPAYQSCQRYFLDVAQHEPGTQALCALINIRLPFQSLNHPISSSSPSSTDTANANANANRSPAGQSSNSTYQFSFPHGTQHPGNLPSPSHSRSRAASSQPPNPFISLIPYLRRLTITGFDKPAILHGFFGDDYTRGVLPHLACERRNYLFAAKHGGWRTCKKQYDAGSGLGGGDETVPFMKPLDGARGEELSAAEMAWGKWMAMEDWMVGPDAPMEGEGNGEMQRGAGRREDRVDERERAMGHLPDDVGDAFRRER